MARKVLLSEYLARTFEPGSRPTQRTGRAMIERGDIPPEAVEKIGHRYFIDLDVIEKDDINELVAGVLKGGKTTQSAQRRPRGESVRKQG